jgi:hypothetical protein
MRWGDTNSLGSPEAAGVCRRAKTSPFSIAPDWPSNPFYYE